MVTRSAKPRRGEGSLGYDATRGQYTLRHTYDGRHYIERAHSEDAVKAKRRARIEQLNARAGLVGGSVEHLCNAWLTYVTAHKGERLTFNTRAGYVRSIHHIVAHLGARPAVELSWREIDAMMIGLANPPAHFSVGTLNQIRNVLRAICRWGVRHDWLAANPALDIEIPAAARRPRERLWFNEDEFRAVAGHLAAEHSTIHTLFLVMLQAGLRPGEALAVRWDAIRDGVLHVEQARQRDRNGVERPSSHLKTDGKTRAAHREIPIAPELAAALKRERVDQLARRGRCDYLFDEITRDRMHDEARRIARAAGVRYVNPNGYRHTFASMCLARGMTYPDCAVLMGHSDTRMLMGVYGHAVATSRPDMARFVGVAR